MMDADETRYREREVAAKERQAMALEQIAQALTFVSTCGRQVIAALLDSEDTVLPPELRERLKLLI